LFVPLFGKSYTVYLLFLPVVILVQYVFALGFCLLISALTVHFRDIKDLLANWLTFWFFSTPIVYPMTYGTIQKSSLLRTFLNLNPMTHIMQGYQSCVFYGSLIHWKKLGITFITALVLFIIGYAIFDRLRDSFPEEV